jgi:LytR cell envelope-related transcriptional attenuator
VFRGLPSSSLVTETLPTVSYTSSGGAAALKVAEPYAQNLITAFNQIGTSTTTTTTAPAKGSKATTTTTAPLEAHSLVGVDVLNASSVTGLAHTTAAALTGQGFQVNEVGDASTPLSTAGTSEILYGPSGVDAARTLASVLSGPVTSVADPSLTSSTVQLVLAGSSLTVTGAASGGTTTTTAPNGPTSTTTTTIPSDVYANKQPEPWNPSPCTLGQPTTTTTTTTKAAKKK